MKCLYLFPVVCGIVLAGLLACPADEKADKNGDKKTQPKTITVTMKSLSYDPKKLEIRVGDSVVWTNKAFAAHTATSDDDGKTFDTGSVEPGESVHGKTMSGTIIVKAAPK